MHFKGPTESGRSYQSFAILCYLLVALAVDDFNWNWPLTRRTGSVWRSWMKPTNSFSSQLPMATCHSLTNGSSKISLLLTFNKQHMIPGQKSSNKNYCDKKLILLRTNNQVSIAIWLNLESPHSAEKNVAFLMKGWFRTQAPEMIRPF